MSDEQQSPTTSNPPPELQEAAGAEDQTDAPPSKPQPKIDPSKDIWQTIVANVKDSVLESADQTALVCGSSTSGKTSIIQRMLRSSADEKTKPTTALEYSYGKREERNTTQIVHFWELAHDGDLAQLADVVITPENIHTAMAIIVIDCASPATAWATLTFWLKRIDSRVSEIFEKMRAKGSSTPDKLLTKARRRVGENHPDADRMRLLGIPIVVVASRLDKLPADTVQAKTFVRTVRFLSHLYGASLCFTSKQDREVAKMRALLNHMIFDMPFDLKMVQPDSEKGGVLLPAGQDTLYEIGDPNPSSPPGFEPTGDSTLDRWKAPFDEAFPPKTQAERAKADEAFKAKLYDTTGKGFGEVAVDQMRKLKDSELEQYRRSSAKKASEKRGDGGE